MITVSGRKLLIPPSEKRIGFTGDNKVETRIFEISDRNLFNMDFRIEAGSIGRTIVPDRQMSEDGAKLRLVWTVTGASLCLSGMLTFQLRGFEPDGDRIWHSDKAFFYVSESFSNGEELAETDVGALLEIEKRVAALSAEAEQSRKAADESRISAEQAARDSAVAFGAIEDFTKSSVETLTASFEDVLDHVENNDDYIYLLSEKIGAIDTALDGLSGVADGYIGGENA